MKKIHRLPKIYKSKDSQHLICVEDSHLGVRTKPTKIAQDCTYCGQPFNKGDKQVIIDKQIQQMSYIRYCYFHPDCFICMLKRLFKCAKLTMKKDCGECEQRFTCYTGGFIKGE